jgi:MerR family copper efflux transcriptional regulator
MQISELASLCGVTAHALRHYEKLGLIRPGRSPGGYRDYPLSMRREVVFISMSRKVGFSLPAIAEQLPAFRAGRLGIDAMVEALRSRMAEIDQQVAALNAQRAEVVSHIAWLQAQQPAPPAPAFQSNRKWKTP